MSEFRARPTLYRGIQMRSRLEADFAAYLDKLGNVWEYEPTCFASEAGQWLPDFRTTAPTETGGTRPVYVELKPVGLLEPSYGEESTALIERVDLLLARMTIAWASEPGTLVQLVFWSFGANGPDYAVLGVPGHPWMAWNTVDEPTVWPGMGRIAAACTGGSVVAR